MQSLLQHRPESNHLLWATAFMLHGGALLRSDSAGNDHRTRFFQLVLSTMQKTPPQTALLILHLNRQRSKCQQLSHVQPVLCHISANSGWVLTMGISLSTPINERICTGVTECDVLIHAWLMVSSVNCYEKCLHSFHKSLVSNSIGNEVIPPITMLERETPQHIQQKSCVLLTAEINIKEKHS